MTEGVTYVRRSVDSLLHTALHGLTSLKSQLASSHAGFCMHGRLSCASASRCPLWAPRCCPSRINTRKIAHLHRNTQPDSAACLLGSPRGWKLRHR